MSGFKVIETQEDFETAVAERLKSERESIEKRYEGFLSPEDVEKKYEGFLSPKVVEEKYKGYLSPEQVKEKDATISKLEKKTKKIQIAMSKGVPYELAGKISGDTEEEMEKDADMLMGFLKKSNPYPDYEPEPEPDEVDTKKAAMKKMLSKLRGE